MTGISMFSSSRDLREGLHRTLAVVAAAVAEDPVAADAAWWSVLPQDRQGAAREGSLALGELMPLFTEAGAYARLEVALARIGSRPPLPVGDLAQSFTDALLSGRALRMHGGRDVYGASNKRLWDALVAPVEVALDQAYGPGFAARQVREARTGEPDPEALRLLTAIMDFATDPDGRGHDACAGWLTEQLVMRGFSVECLRSTGHAPILVAHRPGRGLRGEVLLYGHYDVDAIRDESLWQHDPRKLTLVDGRLWGRGVADNLGPLAARLWAVDTFTRTPALRWVIQGEEEIGSPFAHRVFPGLLSQFRPTVWLEETGYHDHADGTLRLLARTIGKIADSSEPPDEALQGLLLGLRLLMRSCGLATREEHRGLNKAVVDGGCPFNRNLPPGARYIALGVNDSRARIHARDESIPGWTFPVHRDELELLFRWADRAAAVS